MKKHGPSIILIIIFLAIPTFVVYLTIGNTDVLKISIDEVLNYENIIAAIGYLGFNVGSIWIATWLISKKIQGKAICCDQTGITFNFSDQKLMWEEIEKIEHDTITFNIIYIHIKKENIRGVQDRLGFKRAKSYIEIIWYIIDRPKVFYAEAKIGLEEYNKNQK